MNISNFNSQIGPWTLSVDDINIEMGEVTLIYGPSGCGKTSFFQGLLGLNLANFNLEIKDQNLSQIRPTERKFSVVFQANNLFEHLSVVENLLLIKSESISDEDFKLKVKDYKIDSLLSKKANILSGGEKQMVSCVRAFLHKGRRVLLMDEPWSSMDFDNKMEYRNHLIQFLKSENIPCILISHDKDEEISFLNPRFIYDFTQVARFTNGQP